MRLIQTLSAKRQLVLKRPQDQQITNLQMTILEMKNLVMIFFLIKYYVNILKNLKCGKHDANIVYVHKVCVNLWYILNCYRVFGQFYFSLSPQMTE